MADTLTTGAANTLCDTLCDTLSRKRVQYRYYPGEYRYSFQSSGNPFRPHSDPIRYPSAYPSSRGIAEAEWASSASRLRLKQDKQESQDKQEIHEKHRVKICAFDDTHTEVATWN